MINGQEGAIHRFRTIRGVRMDEMVAHEKRVPIISHDGHPFMLYAERQAERATVARRRIAAPASAKPPIIIAQVAGSGTTGPVLSSV